MNTKNTENLGFVSTLRKCYRNNRYRKIGKYRKIDFVLLIFVIKEEGNIKFGIPAIGDIAYRYKIKST